MWFLFGGVFFLLVLGQAALFYFCTPCASHILVIKVLKVQIFGYMLELLHIDTFRTSTYNIKGYNVRGLSGHFYHIMKLNRFA